MTTRPATVHSVVGRGPGEEERSDLTSERGTVTDRVPTRIRSGVFRIESTDNNLSGKCVTRFHTEGY